MPRGYAETYRRSIDRSEEFWAEAAEAIDWEKRWDDVLDDTNPPFYHWFADGRLNTCWNAVDRHVAAGRGDQVALIWDIPVTGQIVRFTYRELRDEVARLAGVLAGLGVVKGDRVLIYMRWCPKRRSPCSPVPASVPSTRSSSAALPRTSSHPDRRRQAAGHPVGLVRHRGQPDHPLQAVARCRDRRGAGPTRALRHSAAANVPCRHGGGPRPGLA